MPLHVLARRHHHVGHFVGDDHDVRHPVRDVGGVGRFLIDSQSLQPFRMVELVVAIQVPDSATGQQVVSLLHLVDGPCQNRLGLFHIRDDGMHEVRNPLVRTQLNHLRVDHQHANLIRSSRGEYRQNERVQADAFSRARSTCDQQVRHLRQVDGHRPPADILAQEEWNPHRLGFFRAAFDQLPQPHHDAVLVRDLNTDRILSGNRRDNSHGRDTQCDRQVIGKARHL